MVSFKSLMTYQSSVYTFYTKAKSNEGSIFNEPYLLKYIISPISLITIYINPSEIYSSSFVGSKIRIGSSYGPYNNP